MALIDKFWLVTLTKDESDAGSDTNRLNLTINVDGEDVLDADFIFLHSWLDEGQAALTPSNTLPSPLESNLLTNSSIRLGIRTDEAWGPEHVLVLGNTERGVIALAMETELEHWLSTDETEGKLTMPLRLVGSGSSSTLIRRVMLVVFTSFHEEAGTNSPVQLQIAAAGNLVLQQQIPPTGQDDFERRFANWYFLDAPIPFTRGDVLANGGINISILGDDAWLPERLFVYGLDTAEGRPNEVVHLVSVLDWDPGWLSTDLQEGEPSVDLPVG